MTIREQAQVFDCAGESLVGIAAGPVGPAADLGVVIVVGGPQYRAGSHRQFVHLCRALAAEGFDTFRFDYRGMGDAGGALRPFDAVDDDIRAAIDAFLQLCPGVRRVVLWGLCDGASAAMIYASSDPRVAGLVLANPWVRDAQTQAVTQVKHYYRGRLLNPAFWKKLLSGGVQVTVALREAAAAVSRAFRRSAAHASTSLGFQQRMLAGWQQFKGPSLVLLCGNDMTAQEFVERVAADPAWQSCMQAERTRREAFPEADHTFSSRQWKDDMARKVGIWLRRWA
ncbi:MAG: hydrolase 1, exosortase A system-associated [Burkholderiales bacterium]|nr:hydrolase 1, exosortase A system-associated [Burkholderiales bacterium]